MNPPSNIFSFTSSSQSKALPHIKQGAAAWALALGSADYFFFALLPKWMLYPTALCGHTTVVTTSGDGERVMAVLWPYIFCPSQLCACWSATSASVWGMGSDTLINPDAPLRGWCTNPFLPPSFPLQSRNTLTTVSSMTAFMCSRWEHSCWSRPILHKSPDTCCTGDHSQGFPSSYVNVPTPSLKISAHIWLKIHQGNLLACGRDVCQGDRSWVGSWRQKKGGFLDRMGWESLLHGP